MYYLRIYFENSIREVKLREGKNYSFGSGHREDILYKDFPKDMSPIRFMVGGDSWTVTKANKKVNLHSLVNEALEFNKVYIVNDLLEVAFAVYKLEEEDTIVYKVNKTEIVVGSDNSCDVVIKDRYIAKKQIKLLRYGDKWYFEDLGSANGTYVNGKQFTHLMLMDSDELILGFAKININHNILTIKYRGNVTFNLPNLSRDKVVSNLNAEYPYYYKPHTRLKEDVPTDEIDIEKAPNIGARPTIKWITVLLPPIAMATIMITVCIITSMSPVALFMTVPMLMVGAIAAVLGYRTEVANFAAKIKQRTKVYEKYLDDQVSHMHKLSNQQRKALNLDNPSTKYLMESVEAMSAIWDRSPRDKDFMTLRIGSGTVRATFKINVPRNQLELEEDKYMSEIMQVAQECRNVNNVPITIDLHAHCSLGIIGNKARRDALTKNLIYQAAGHHNYDNLKIVLICDGNEANDYSFVRYLPHNYDDQRIVRFYADDKVSSTNMLDKIADVIEERESAKNGDEGIISPYYLIISLSKSLTLNHAISRKLTQLSADCSVGTVFNYDNIHDLPNDCYYICDVTSNYPVMYEKDHASVKNNFIIDEVEHQDYEKYARKMLPIITDTENKSIGFPTSITFMQGLRANNFAQLNVEKNWQGATPERSMAVPIGKTSTGEDFLFDIHEKSMGPHGLVAGMTGSGKSEAVQTFLLSLAVKFPPEAVSFVIVDFKGTGLILPFRKMPHLAGTISDIDTNISRNLIALMTELERRKALLDKYKVSNISSYLKLYREGKADVPLSYMMIVIDEFAEFKKKFPDFMKAVSTIFRIGRTLGVHIILLTQKPANVVDDEMNANTRFRWCLKVASSSDSNDMLHHPDAAKIINPGRAYVQVGEDEIYEQVQTYYSGAKFSEDATGGKVITRMSVVDKYGKRMVLKEKGSNIDNSKESEINYVVRNLAEFAANNNYASAKKVWSDKLATIVSLDSIEKARFDGEKYQDAKNVVYSPTIGLIDDPRTQEQEPLNIEFTEKGNYTVYGSPGTGKTTLLNTIIYSTIMNYTPDEVNMYILDFGGGSLNMYNSLPHIGGIVLPEDGDKLSMLTRMLEAELNKRKKLFAKAGLTNIGAYKSANPGERMPYILLMIDNYAYAVQSYPDLPDFLLTYIRDGANYGMYFINAVSTTSSMSFRLSENIKNKLSLYMSEKADYNSIFSMPPGITIDNIKGHGICKLDKYCVEYQTAIPIDDADENKRVFAIRDQVEKINKSWTGNRAKPIPVLPEKINYKDKENETNNILLGISKAEVEKVEIDISQRPFILVSNYRNDELENVLYEQINYKYNIKTKILYGNFDRVEPDYSLDSEKILEELENVVKELDERKNALKGDSVLDSEKYPYILIYIKAYTEFLDEVDEKAKDILNNIVKLGKHLNVIVVIEDTSNRITNHLNNDKAVIKINDVGTVIVAGGTINDNHQFLQINLPYNEKNAPILNDEAYIVTKNDRGESEFKYIRTCVR